MLTWVAVVCRNVSGMPYPEEPLGKHKHDDWCNLSKWPCSYFYRILVLQVRSFALTFVRTIMLKNELFLSLTLLNLFALITISECFKILVAKAADKVQKLRYMVCKFTSSADCRVHSMHMWLWRVHCFPVLQVADTERTRRDYGKQPWLRLNADIHLTKSRSGSSNVVYTLFWQQTTNRESDWLHGAKDDLHQNPGRDPQTTKLLKPGRQTDWTRG